MQQEKKSHQIIASSALASTIISFITNPLDVVKTRLQRNAMECKEQLLHERKFGRSLFSFGPEPANIAEMHCKCIPHNSTIKVIAYIVRKEGIRTLANGIKSSMLMSATSHTAFMFFYENFKKEISKITNHAVIMPLAASLLTRVAVTSLLFPVDRFRTLQQSASGESKVRLSDLRVNLKAGYGPLMVRDIVFSGIYWVAIENIRVFMMNKMPQDTKYLEMGQKILLVNSITGGLAGCLAALITLPFDVVKTRLQISDTLGSTSGRQILRDIYYKEGIPALFTGFRQRLVKVGITCSGVLALYEYFNHLLQVSKRLE